MNRIPEPELMSDDAQAQAYAEADFAEPHDRFVALLQERLPDLAARGVALDLGCGPADVTIRFARAFPGWAIDAIDGSAAMLRYGREAVASKGLADRIRLIEAYLPDCDDLRPGFDLVFSNSLLHHLRDPSVLWQCLRRWAQPGCAVFVMDLMRPESRDEARRLVQHYSGAEPEVLRRDFFNSLLAAYTVDEVRGQLRQAMLPQLQTEAVSDRHLIVWGVAASVQNRDSSAE